MFRSLAASVGRVLERSGENVTILELRQAGWYREVPEEETVPAFRMAQLRTISIAAGLAFLVGMVLGSSPVQRIVLVVLGVVIGATRQRASLQSAIEQRRETMCIEIYTVNQLLAMRVRAGGGVVHAVQDVVRRGEGEVVGELADALRLHRAGWRAGRCVSADRRVDPGAVLRPHLPTSGDRRGEGSGSRPGSSRSGGGRQGDTSRDNEAIGDQTQGSHVGANDRHPGPSPSALCGGASSLSDHWLAMKGG